MKDFDLTDQKLIKEIMHKNKYNLCLFAMNNFGDFQISRKFDI